MIGKVELRQMKGYPANGCDRGCWRPATTQEHITPGGPLAQVCQVGDCPPRPTCPVCEERPVRGRVTRAGAAPATCSPRCSNRAAECRRQGIAINTPIRRGEELRAARRAAGQKRKGGKRHVLPDGLGAWATPAGLKRAQEALKRAEAGIIDPSVSLARLEPPPHRVAAIQAALASWFLRGYLRGRAEAGRTT